MLVLKAPKELSFTSANGRPPRQHIIISASLHEPGYQDELRNFSPVSEMRKGQRSWGRVLAPNLRTKQTWENTKILTFGPIIASVTLKAVSL